MKKKINKKLLQLFDEQPKIEEVKIIKEQKLISKKDKEYIKKFIQGERKYFNHLESLWEKIKNEEPNDDYFRFLDILMNDRMDLQKEFMKLKQNILKDA